jgi:hypothetical protein
MTTTMAPTNQSETNDFSPKTKRDAVEQTITENDLENNNSFLSKEKRSKSLNAEDKKHKAHKNNKSLKIKNKS